MSSPALPNASLDMHFEWHSRAESIRMRKRLKATKGAGVIEIVTDFRADTYRTIYTVSSPGVIFPLHAFKKKSRRGSATSKADLDLIRRRLRRALNICNSPPIELTSLIAEYGIAIKAYEVRSILRTDVKYG